MHAVIMPLIGIYTPAIRPAEANRESFLGSLHHTVKPIRAKCRAPAASMIKHL